VATPLNSLSWPRVLEPEEPVLNSTDEVLGAFARYQISTGPTLLRQECAALTHPDGAVMESMKQLPFRSEIVATRRSPEVDAVENVSVIELPAPVISLPFFTNAIAAEAG
jgi:hypothetical protein